MWERITEHKSDMNQPKNIEEKSLEKASSFTHSAQNIRRSEYLSSSLYTTSIIT